MLYTLSLHSLHVNKISINLEKYQLYAVGKMTSCPWLNSTTEISLKFFKC